MNDFIVETPNYEIMEIKIKIKTYIKLRWSFEGQC